ncbi:hypothetical protein GXW82_10885 [Streptacidiphilus sp. 4-A2]|nr:hypothetical protein [Streptacidiphilus sp. 4-A2]
MELVAADGTVVSLAPKRRIVLAVLAVDLDRVVSVDRLVDAVWEQEPPVHARQVVQDHVGALRRVLAGGMSIATSPSAYLLGGDPGRVDLYQFTARAAVARAADPERPQEAITRLRRALGLWRGPPRTTVPEAPCASMPSCGLAARCWPPRGLHAPLLCGYAPCVMAGFKWSPDSGDAS